MCTPLHMLAPLSLLQDSLVLLSYCNRHRLVPQSSGHSQAAPLTMTISIYLLLQLGLPLDHHLVRSEVVLRHQWCWTRVVISLRIHPWHPWKLIVRLILVTILVLRMRVQVVGRLDIKPSSCITLFPSSKSRRRNFVIPPFTVPVNTMTTSTDVHSGSLRRRLRHRHHIPHAPDLPALDIQIILL
jgi:hypothetical protein